MFEVTRAQKTNSANDQPSEMQWAVGIMADENYAPSSFMRIVSTHGNDWNAADNECMKRNMMFAGETHNVN